MPQLNWSPQQLSRCIAFVNGKGGVGKTSLVANLAGLYANGGYRVLVIDLDPQGNVGNDLGYIGTGRTDDGEALVNAVSNHQALVPMTEVRPNLDICCGGDQLDELSDALDKHTDGGGETELAAALAQVAENYDLVLIDCPPRNKPLQPPCIPASEWGVHPDKREGGSPPGHSKGSPPFMDVRETVNPGL